MHGDETEFAGRRLCAVAPPVSDCRAARRIRSGCRCRRCRSRSRFGHRRCRCCLHSRQFGYPSPVVAGRTPGRGHRRPAESARRTTGRPLPTSCRCARWYSRIRLPPPQKLAVTRTAPCGCGSPPRLSPRHCVLASTPPPLKVITTTIEGNPGVGRIGGQPGCRRPAHRLGHRAEHRLVGLLRRGIGMALDPDQQRTGRHGVPGECARSRDSGRWRWCWAYRRIPPKPPGRAPQRTMPRPACVRTAQTSKPSGVELVR